MNAEHQPHRARTISIAAAIALALVAGGCGSSNDTDEGAAQTAETGATPEADATTTSAEPGATTTSPTAPTTAADTTAAPTTTAEPTTTTTAPPVLGDFPTAPETAAAAITMLVDAEQAIADPAVVGVELQTQARRQQVAYRAIGENPEWDGEVMAEVPEELQAAVVNHLAARRAFISMRTRLSDSLPAWEITEPAPAEELLGYYMEAEEETGIEWEYLAAINLVESAIGRIQGLSTAGAQGPMQFLPSTWEAYAEGDIWDPHDAIIGAGTYLAASGGPEDMDRAIWAYNHHDGYVEGVSRYAAILRDNPDAYRSLYHWEVVFTSDQGDVYIPVGYRQTEPILVADYLAAN